MANAAKVSVKVASWNIGSFDPQMQGVPAITHDLQEIPESKLEELEKRAESAGVALSRSDVQDPDQKGDD